MLYITHFAQISYYESLQKPPCQSLYIIPEYNRSSIVTNYISYWHQSIQDSYRYVFNCKSPNYKSSFFGRYLFIECDVEFDMINEDYHKFLPKKFRFQESFLSLGHVFRWDYNENSTHIKYYLDFPFFYPVLLELKHNNNSKSDVNYTNFFSIEEYNLKYNSSESKHLIKERYRNITADVFLDQFKELVFKISEKFYEDDLFKIDDNIFQKKSHIKLTHTKHSFIEKSSESIWFPIVYSSTYSTDFKFLALPDHFKSENDSLASIKEYINITFIESEKLSETQRYSIFRVNEHVIFGVSLFLNSFENQPSIDDNNRETYLFMGFISGVSGKKYIPSISEIDSDYKIQLLKFINRHWETNTYEDIFDTESFEIKFKDDINQKKIALNFRSNATNEFVDSEDNRLTIWESARNAYLNGLMPSVCLGLPKTCSGKVSAFNNISINKEKNYSNFNEQN